MKKYHRRVLIAFGFTLFVFLLQAGISPAGETYDPVADPGSVVVCGQARFTVLFPQLIRMEWASDSRFEDNASLVFINRKLPVPEYEKKLTNGWLIDFPASPVQASALLNGFPGKLARLKRIIPFCNSLWPREWSPEGLLKAVQTGNRIGLFPKTAQEELKAFEQILPDVVRQVTALKEVNEEVIGRVLAHLTGMKP